MELNKIQESIAEDFSRVNSLIIESLESEVDYLNTINRYLLDLKGKQIRPLLSLITAKACGEVNNLTISCAAVSEMIHTATLMHDDVADNSSVRRGAPTVQSKFSPAASVLTGDYWLAKALSLLVKENDPRVLGFFTRAVEELSEGELFQMQKASKLDTSESDYLHIITRKTSSLFVAAVASAAYSCGAGDKIIEDMGKYAYHLGIAFQIRDDIFDYMPDLNTGKNAGSDIREKKITLPLICALNNAGENERGEMLRVIKESRYDDDSLVSKTLDFVKKYNGISSAQEALSKHSGIAIGALSGLGESKFKQELADIANYVGTRLI